MNSALKYIVAAAVLGSFGFAMYVLAFQTVPTENKDLFIHALGIIEGAVVTLVSFHFGSSQGSKDKTEVIQTMVKKVNGEPPVIS